VISTYKDRRRGRAFLTMHGLLSVRRDEDLAPLGARTQIPEPDTSLLSTAQQTSTAPIGERSRRPSATPNEGPEGWRSRGSLDRHVRPHAGIYESFTHQQCSISSCGALFSFRRGWRSATGGGGGGWGGERQPDPRGPGFQVFGSKRVEAWTSWTIVRIWSPSPLKRARRTGCRLRGHR